MFPDFERMFIDQYVPLDDKNIAQDKLTRAAVAWHHTGIHYLILQCHSVALPDLVTDNAIHAFIYGLETMVKGIYKGTSISDD